MKKSEQWTVEPVLGSENTYRVWDKHGNYHKDTSEFAMVYRAKVMQSAPALLQALRSIAGNTCCGSCQEAKLVAQQALDQLNII